MPGKRRGAWLAHEVDLDELQRRGNREIFGTGKPKVVDVVGVSVVGNEGGGHVGVVVVQRKLVMGRLRGLTRQVGLSWERGIRALLEAHPAISPQEDGVLHISCKKDASPYCQGGGVSLVVLKLDA